MPKKNNGIRFSSLFQPAQVICRTQQTDRDAILLDLLRLLAYEHGIGNVDEAYQAVLARENEIPTIVGPGIAMPHARLEAIDSIVVGVATSEKGIIYDRKKTDNPIKLIILTLVPKAAPGAYLQAISSLAKICQDPSTAEVVAGLADAEKVWSFFEQGGLNLPDHLSARDIMEPVTLKLQEQDTLERAIDMFVRHGLNELPVLDKDGDLIGVVSTYEFLRVCLPDYVLWMEDLTPIMNFQPFAEILRKESKTWLTEIMTSEYAIVEETAPAVQVAKEITRQHADRAYVVRGKKLVGIVSLATFLSKILRE
ncbi:MAG TPA: PTS sugar transporter subunit IIA [Sedimentisphaerales bacterium]|nr:PTS sugar transporter subunit IIA [Sedimentisphaerales bacterium]